MKKSTLEKIEEEVEKKTKLSKEDKKEIRNKIVLNTAIALMIIVYFVGIILLSIYASKNIREVYLKISSMVAIIMSITIFEVAYKKDSGKIAIFGIEVLIMAIANLFLPYLLYKLNIQYIKIIIIAVGIFSIYYIIKLLIIYIHNKRKILKDNSDIKNIIKRESSYPEKIEVEGSIASPEIKPKKRGRPKKAIKEETESANAKKIDNTSTKKRERTRKTEQKEINKNNNINKKINNRSNTKRGRPKKVIVEETNIKKSDNVSTKRRGRPRKQDINNKEKGEK